MRRNILLFLGFLFLFLGFLGFAPVHIPINDKVMHTLTFGTVAFVLFFLWDLGLERNLALTCTAMLLMSFGSEMVQGLLPYRTYDTKDIAANLCGSLLGIGLAVFLERWQERQRWLGVANSQGDYTQLRVGESEVLEMV
ncbi:hypothetical protein BC938DRAFT_479093 [Jimgerdemannia flammicorona]|uniref:VanZ-like domain-containing protein n=1 Tax=Jimgerdemannia flammicorona TaxID=994334 RepID=A0A433QLK1_9FUNG|nr:hypothetical protein BC938DRAFT_479093 [Jimgerdemannia flammicorona]